MSRFALIKSLVPPVLWSALGSFRKPTVSFAGDYASWDEAQRHATGYDAQPILDRVISATRAVEDGRAAFERDAVTFDRIEYSWPLLAALLLVAAEAGSLRVLDFGGSLGTTWRQNARFLRRLKVPVTWCVVEQPAFVEAGKALFSGERLRFEESTVAAAAEGVDVALFASSLCYIPDPAGAIASIEATAAKYLILDRTPLSQGPRDRFTLQRVREPIYPARYPVRIFSRERLLADLLRSWRLIEEWNCDLQPDGDSESRGLFLERQ